MYSTLRNVVHKHLHSNERLAAATACCCYYNQAAATPPHAGQAAAATAHCSQDGQRTLVGKTGQLLAFPVLIPENKGATC